MDGRILELIIFTYLRLEPYSQLESLVNFVLRVAPNFSTSSMVYMRVFWRWRGFNLETNF